MPHMKINSKVFKHFNLEIKAIKTLVGRGRDKDCWWLCSREVARYLPGVCEDLASNSIIRGTGKETETMPDHPGFDSDFSTVNPNTRENKCHNHEKL